MLKRKKVVVPLALAIAAATYFTAAANLENNFLLSAGLVMLPVQVGACIYFLYLYWQGRLKGTSRYQTGQRPRDTQGQA